MPDDELLSAAYRKTFKLALAVSIIRSKPSHLSSREYAQHLAQQIKSIESSWKSKYEKISAELLETRQQILLLHLKNETTLQPISSFAKGDDGRINPAEAESVLSEDAMVVHHNFLSSIASLRQWNESLQNNQRSMETIKESVCTALRQFNSCLDGIPLNEHNFVLISENLIAISELARKNLTMDEELIFYCASIVEQLIRMTSNAEQTICEKLSSLLLLLGETSDTLRDLILEKLVDVICSYSKLLAHTDCFSDLNVGTYEIMFFICEALTHLFASTCQRWPLEKHDLLAKQLEEGVLPISGRYPMYAHELWVISSLLAENSSLEEEEDSLFSQKDSL